ARVAPPVRGAGRVVLWGGAHGGSTASRHNPVDYARGVSCPVLLLHGAADSRVRTEHVEEVAANLPGPSELVVFEGLGHESYVARREGRWKREVEGFLRRRAVVK